MLFEYLENTPLPTKFLLARPNQHIIGSLQGVVSALISPKFNDIWEIDFEVDKYTNGKINPLFDRIISLMEIYVENLGWFQITKPPQEIDDDRRVYKKFTAYGYECVLQDIDIVMFYINTGTEISQEMFTENLNEIGIPKQNIKMYIPDSCDDPKADNYWNLGLLNILEHEYLSKKGWTIGEIDSSLAPLRGRKFEIDSTNLYAFLTQDISKAYKCVFVFDRINKKINAYPINKIGKPLNIEFSKRNIINKVNIDFSNTSDSINTRFRVSGKDEDQNIFEYINFGSPFLDNISYLLESKLLTDDTVEKYKSYEIFRESKRSEYATIIKQRLENNEKISSLENLMPVDEVSKIWRTLTDEELDIEIEHFNAVIKTLEELHTIDGILNIEETPDYALYLSIKNVILPDLTSEKERRKNGSTVDAPRVDYKTNWELYGTNELTAQKKSYESQIEVMIQAGYDKEWEDFNKFQKGFTLVRDTDYTVEYSNNVNVGVANVSVKGKGIFTGIKETTFEIVNKTRSNTSGSTQSAEPNIPAGSIESCTIDPIPLQQYTGNPITPTIIVKYAGKERPINQDAYMKQHQLYLQYKGYITDIQARLDILNARITELNDNNKILSEQQQGLIEQVSMKDPAFGFTEDEISDINFLFRETDYIDKNIEVLETDTIDDIIQHAWDLYESAKEQLEIESRPQLTYSIDMDNPYFISRFQDKMKNLEMGDFIFMELDNGRKIKQRVIELSNIELVNFNETDFNIKFSDMVTCYGMADDYRFILDNTGNSSSKNQISKDIQNYVSTTASSITTQLFNKYISSGSGDGIFTGGISQSDLQKLQDALDGLIGGTMSLEELKVNLAQIDTLDANSAFIKYMETQFLVGNQAEFKELRAKLGLIDDLIAGNVSAELGHLIHLTAQNVSIDEAVIKDIIAAQIMVSDLKAGTIDTDKMNISSEDGNFTIVGNTMQFKDSNGNVRIQMGQDAQGNFSFTVYSSDGQGVLIDESGIHDSAISDGLIKNDMLAGGITKEKMDWNVVEGDENGNLSAGKVIVNGHGIDVEFTTIKQTTQTLNEKIEENIQFRLEGDSSEGTVFFNNIIDTNLSVILYRGNYIVTDEYPDSCFVWSRSSKNPELDEYWNSQHTDGKKILHVTTEDMNGITKFKCSFILNNTVQALKEF